MIFVMTCLKAGLSKEMFPDARSRGECERDVKKAKLFDDVFLLSLKIY